MSRQSLLRFIPIGIMLVLLFPSSPMRAQTSATVRLSPLVLGVNQTGVINAIIDCPAQNCALFSGSLVFDPALLRVDAAEIGGFLGDSGQVFVDPAANLVNNPAGIVQLSALNVGTPSRNADNTLFRLTVTALAPGDVFVMFTALTLADPLNNLIPATGVGAVVTAQDPASTMTIPNGQAVSVGLVTASDESAAQEGAVIALEGQPTLTVGSAALSVTLQTAACADAAFASDLAGAISLACADACLSSGAFPMVALGCPADASSGANLHHLIPADELRSRFVADFVFGDLQFTRMAVVYDASPLNQRLAEQVSQHYTDLGGVVVSTRLIDLSDSSLFSALADESPQAVFFAASPQNAQALLQGRASLAGIPFIGTDAVAADSLLQVTQSAAQPVFVVNSPSEGERMDIALTGLSSSDPRLLDPSFTGGYDAALLLLDAIENTSRVDETGSVIIDRQAISRYLDRVRDFTALGGILYADNLGNVSVRGLTLVQTGQNQLAEVKALDGDIFPALDEYCTVRPAQTQIAVYVGPDTSRAVRQSMTSSDETVATGWAVAADGSRWWRLQPPTGSAELDRYWVRQDDVLEAGSCALMPPVPGSAFIAQPTVPTTVPGTGTARQESMTVTLPS